MEQLGCKLRSNSLCAGPTGRLKDIHLREFKLEFDIEWVTDNEHWSVEVTKWPVTSQFKSRVNTRTQTIYLADYDTNNRAIDSTKPDILINPVGHEFGHTFYPVDDYGKRYGNDHNGPYINDLRGLMTIGSEFRKRYVEDLEETLIAMIPGVRLRLFLK